MKLHNQGKLRGVLHPNGLCIIVEVSPFSRAKKRQSRIVRECRKWKRRVMGAHWRWSYIARNDCEPTERMSLTAYVPGNRLVDEWREWVTKRGIE